MYVSLLLQKVCIRKDDHIRFLMSWQPVLPIPKTDLAIASLRIFSIFIVSFISPPEQGNSPSEEGTSPSEEDTSPTDEVTSPLEEGTSPTEEGTSPMEKGTSPTE